MLIISPPSSYRVAPFVEAAASLGLEPIVVSHGQHSLVGRVAGGIHVDFADPDGACRIILDALGDEPVRGVVGTDDSVVALAARLGARLGLRHNAVEAAVLSRRKDLARARLQAAGVAVPCHRLVDLDQPLTPQADGLDYPVVAKPLALSGSRGVIRADDTAQLLAACRRIGAIIGDDTSLTAEERRRVLIEAFIDGPEVALEGILDGGRLRVLALFDKPDPLNGPFFEETYYVTPSRLPPEVQALAHLRVQQACDAYGLRHGPVHAELRIHEGEAWIVEVAGRTIGGQCARLLQFGAGRSLEQLVVAHAAGLSLSCEQRSEAAGVLMIPIPGGGLLRRVEGVLQARAVPGVEAVEISVREGYELVPLPEGSSYLGFIFARGSDPAEVEQALRAAHACLNIVTAPVFPLRPGGR